MRISGKFVDVNTGKPVPNATINLFLTSNITGTPDDTQSSQDDGSYDFSTAIADSPTASWSTSPIGYNQMTGTPGYLNGTVELYPTVLGQIPWWAYAAIAVIVLGVIHFKYKKLF